MKIRATRRKDVAMRVKFLTFDYQRRVAVELILPKIMQALYQVFGIRFLCFLSHFYLDRRKLTPVLVLSQDSSDLWVLILAIRCIYEREKYKEFHKVFKKKVNPAGKRNCPK